MERRFAGGRQERLAEFVADLAERRVDVVVATSEVESIAAKRGLPTTPIVMIVVQDPVEAGLVASLARPGGTVTGLTTLAPELYRKRLELLKEALPQVARAGVLVNPRNTGPGRTQWTMRPGSCDSSSGVWKSARRGSLPTPLRR